MIVHAAPQPHPYFDAERCLRETLDGDVAAVVVGLDLAHDLLPVGPAAHYLMGGVVTDLDGRTSLPGLFAAGEVACTGVHGANRLASNSLLEGLVFGGRAGRAMVEPEAWSSPATEPRRSAVSGRSVTSSRTPPMSFAIRSPRFGRRVRSGRWLKRPKSRCAGATT